MNKKRYGIQKEPSKVIAVTKTCGRLPKINIRILLDFSNL
jgi:hypothetical protein